MPIYSQMIKSAPRSLLRFSRPITRPVRPQRQFSTAPPAQRSRSWRNTTVRWALAIGGIYYYNTSNVFAEEPTFELLAPSSPTDDTPIQTLESLAASRKSKDAPSNLSSSSQVSPESSPQTPLIDNPLSTDEAEQEASQQGAFNEETGEINWDCPCLGGMAHGPCGEEFRAAFSCFIYSKEEPKGMECIENFKGMQDCFRQHPEIYGSELEDGDGDEGDVEPLPLETDDLSRSHSSADETTTPPPNVSDGDVNEGDVKPPSSQSKEPSTIPATPSPEVDELSEYTASTQKSAPEHPQVDEPSTYPQASSDPSQQPPTSNPQ